MAKIYGNPITFGGGGGQNADLPPLLDNFKANNSTSFDDPSVVGGLPIGALIKVPVQAEQQSEFGEYIVLEKVDQDHQGYPANSVTLMSRDLTMVRALEAQDAKSDWNKCALKQYLNSNKGAGEWFEVLWDGQNPPDSSSALSNPYAEKAGFLNVLDSDFVESILETEVEGEQNLIFIPTVAEMGLSMDDIYGVQPETYALAKFTDNISRIKSITQACFDNSEEPDSSFISGYEYGHWGANQAFYYATRTLFDSSAEQGFRAGVSFDGSRFFNFRPLNFFRPNGELGIAFICNIPNNICVFHNDDGTYSLEYSQSLIEISADKMEESRAEQLAGAVWVYGDHSPANVNDGTKIQLTREECITPSLEGEDVSVNRSIPWSKTKDFYARQFTYNSKKQYQTMLEGALASVIVEGAPAQVTDLVVSGSGGTATLTWVNPVDDPVYAETVVVQKVGSAPSDITDGTEIYRGTDQTYTATGLEQSTDYYFAVYTLNSLGIYKQPVVSEVYRYIGKPISELALKDKVKLGRYNDLDLQWLVADHTDGTTTLVLDVSSVLSIGVVQFDAPEPSNPGFIRREKGNNRYIYTNAHQWLNSKGAANQWYTAQHSYDAPPSYQNKSAFLYEWAEKDLKVLLNTTWEVTKNAADGGGIETFISMIVVPSTTEVGLESNTGGKKLAMFNSDTDRSIGDWYWLRTPGDDGPEIVKAVYETGSIGIVRAGAHYSHLIRPICKVLSLSSMTLNPDSDGCYTFI